MPNPRIQIIVEPALRQRLKAEAKKRSLTVSAYCSQLLRDLHEYQTIFVAGSRELAAAIRALLTKLKD